MSNTPLLELARVVRSKNSGPFELVLDVIFKDRATFEQLRSTQQFTAPRVAEVYGLPVAAIHSIVWFEPAHAVKVVLQRKMVSGAPGDGDVYGAQQHAPLLSLTFEV